MLDAVCEAYPGKKGGGAPSDRMGLGDSGHLLALSFDAGVRTVAQRYHEERRKREEDGGESRTKAERVAEAAQGLEGAINRMPEGHPERLRLERLLAARQ